MTVVNSNRLRPPLRIAQVAPLVESVPPKTYGGTERVVSWLTEELVAAGHDVTLFAAGDSITTARLEPCAPCGLRLGGIHDPIASHLTMLERVRRQRSDFDIIHFHIDLLQFPHTQEFAHRCLTTMHGRLDLPDFHPVYEAFPTMPLVSISQSQREGVPNSVNWLANIPHGLPGRALPFSPQGGAYLAFLGRISPEKRADRAIAVATATGWPLRIAAKIDRADRAYFEEVVKPLLDHPLVEYIGEIDETEKAEFLGQAAALLFPISWPEPFGLVMVEAMSCGTPVIAWNCGSVPEVVEHGVNGFIVESFDEAITAVCALDRLSRREVRRSFEARFTSRRMAEQYVLGYEKLLLLQEDEHGSKSASPSQRSSRDLIQVAAHANAAPASSTGLSGGA